MSDEDDLARLATDTLSKMIEEYGSVNTTVGQLLAQFGHDEITSDAIDDVWIALRDAGLRETPTLNESGLTPESKIKVGRVESKQAREERSFITWGFITAVLFAPVGIFFGIRLLIRDRVGPGLAVILTAVALWGAGIVIVLGQHGSGPAAQNYNAHDPSLQSEVESAIETNSASSASGLTVSNVSCVAQSNSTMTCLGNVTSSDGSTGQATYNVTLDTNTGHYLIGTPAITLTGGGASAIP
jgi:hypothetical protein